MSKLLQQETIKMCLGEDFKARLTQAPGVLQGMEKSVGENG
jgi:hypothetical protein